MTKKLSLKERIGRYSKKENKKSKKSFKKSVKGAIKRRKDSRKAKRLPEWKKTRKSGSFA